MKAFRPDQPEPIPVRGGPHRLGHIILRFAALLVIATGLMVLAWMR